MSVCILCNQRKPCMSHHFSGLCLHWPRNLGSRSQSEPLSHCLATGKHAWPRRAGSCAHNDCTPCRILQQNPTQRAPSPHVPALRRPSDPGPSAARTPAAPTPSSGRRPAPTHVGLAAGERPNPFNFTSIKRLLCAKLRAPGWPQKTYRLSETSLCPLKKIREGGPHPTSQAGLPSQCPPRPTLSSPAQSLRPARGPRGKASRSAHTHAHGGGGHA